jgi:DNA-binding NarL/FixJ family response regulator
VETCGRGGTCKSAQAGVAFEVELDRPTPAMTNDTRLIRILSVDDHPLLRSGIAALVDTQSDMRMVGEASNGNEAVQLHRELNPDVTLMDLQMPDMSGLDAIISIRTEQPAARIIVLTTFAGDVLAQRALKAGAQAYVLKSLVRTEILNTIRDVYAGEKQIQADVAAEIAKHMAHALLTARELEVLKLVASGHANKVISAHLDIHEETTKTHIKNILAKLGARDRTHAVSLGLKRGIILL